jgi:hypothetical protein
LEGDDPRLGPMVIAGDRIWAFVGQRRTDPTRDVVELIPQDPGAPR